ncbi:MAG TPA: beta-ketoacyl-[acyl-carrier-protein] synthase family protein, partial [Pirellulaceae bacterium]
IPVVAAKANFGNLGAAGGLVELVGSLLAMRHDSLFPSATYETADPKCPLRVIQGPHPPGSRLLKINVTPSGQAAALLVSTAWNEI